MKDYSGKKRLIQSYFYNKVTTKTSIVALAGNNLDLHITDFKNILGKKKKAFIYDVDNSVIAKFKYLENEQIQLINSNVINCEICRFIDLDLMATLSSIEGIVYYIFNSQYRKYKFGTYKNTTKTFMFTYSTRGNKRDIYKFLNAMFEDKQISILYKEIKPYRDSSPMCTVFIQYK